MKTNEDELKNEDVFKSYSRTPQSGGKELKAQRFLQKVQPFNNFNIDKTFPAEAYSCLQVCVF